MAILGLFSGKGDHPLADPKEARDALASMAASNPLAAVADLAAWLESLPSVAGLKLERRIELALQLDEAGVVHARRLARDYLTPQRSSRAQEFKIWTAARAYWQRLIDAYEDCFAQIAATRKNPGAEQYALLDARAVHAHGAALKWEQFRYGPVEPGIWPATGRVYLQAQTGKLATRPLKLYPNAPDATSVEREYLKILVFHAASMDKLLPLEIELAERLIAHFLPHFVLTDQVRPENVYWVDVGGDLPPARLARPPAPSSSLRFFTTAQALDAVAQLKDKIERMKEVPADVPLGGQYPPPTVLAVLEHFAHCWAPTPPMRNAARHNVKNMLAVIHGMDEILARLSGSGNQGGETWVADNVSLGGMGAKLALAATNDWLQVGALIAMRPEGSSQWLVGLVRRFVRHSQSQGTVGIETIGKSPRAVRIVCSGVKGDAVLLESTLHQGEMVSMVVPDHAWQDFMPVSVDLDGSSARLLPFGISYHGSGFLVARYRVDAAG